MKSRDRTEQYYPKNYNKIITPQNKYVKNRKGSDLNFILVCNLTSRTNQGFKSQNIKKSNKTIVLLGCFH